MLLFKVKDACIYSQTVQHAVAKQGFDHMTSSVVQLFKSVVFSKTAGVMFTVIVTGNV